jgi:hypothetical protein
MFAYLTLLFDHRAWRGGAATRSAAHGGADEPGGRSAT